MKIRQGFVSNSSSSSFVAVGIKIKKSEIPDILRDKIDEDGQLTIYENDENGYWDNEFAVIGEEVANGDEYYLNRTEVPIKDLVDIIRSFTGLEDIDGEPVLITGTKAN